MSALPKSASKNTRRCWNFQQNKPNEIHPKIQWSLVPGILVLFSLINVFCDNDKIPKMVASMVYNGTSTISGLFTPVLYSLLFEN